MLFGSSAIIGLDIGTRSIKLFELQQARRGATLTNFNWVSTPAGAINGGEITNPEAVSEAILSLLQVTRVKSKKICVGIWGTAVKIKKVSIPVFEKNMKEEDLLFSLNDYISSNISEVNIGYHVLGDRRSSSDQMSVLLVEAKKDFVNQYVEVVEAAGLECSIIDVSGFALANAFEFNYGIYSGEAVAVLNFGAGVTNFVVVEEGEVAFVRDIPVGGNTYTLEIQKSMGAISLEDADHFKESAGRGEKVPKEVMDAISQTNESVVNDLKQSFDIYQHSLGIEAAITRVFVTGGGLWVPGLYQQIQAKFNLPTENLNPFKNITVAKNILRDFTEEQIAPYSAVGIGLALRTARDR